MNGKLKRLMSLIFILSFFGCREDLMVDLDQVTATKIKDKLNQENINSSIERRGTSWTVTVDPKDSARATNVILKDRTIVIDSPTKGTDSGSGLFLSKEERIERANYQKERELEKTIQNIKGVILVRVHLNKHSEVVNKKDDPLSTASVLVTTASSSVNELSLSIRGMVAGASGIREDRISVIFTKPEESSVGELVSGESPTAKNDLGSKVKREDRDSDLRLKGDVEVRKNISSPTEEGKILSDKIYSEEGVGASPKNSSFAKIGIESFRQIFFRYCNVFIGMGLLILSLIVFKKFYLDERFGGSAEEYQSSRRVRR